ncbi:MAG: tetraacyldisaccharide 4'-kinase [Hydrogenothermaceae bacterium]|nr:tetraacyldisaccharide 4'-kinase [Hydrogenothermaceae bacterium]
MFRKLLFPLSLIYGLGAILNRKLYELGIRKSYKLPLPVISVGNLSVGGTGKTPTVISIAKYFQNKNRKVLILSRGYKRKSKEILLCNKNMPVELCGDEPKLMTYKGLDVVVSSDRVRGFEFAKDKVNPDIVILDDGYQHHSIKKDINILLIDATKPFWEDSLLPSGNLREPKSFFRYGDCFIIVRFDRVKNKDRFMKKLKTFNKPFFIAEEQFGELYNENDKIDFSSLKGKSVIVMAGIGNNQQFFDKIQEFSLKYGFYIENFLDFPDHYDYKDFTPDVNKTYITTEKDIVKLNFPNIYAVNYSFDFDTEFYRYLEELNGGEKSV